MLFRSQPFRGLVEILGEVAATPKIAGAGISGVEGQIASLDEIFSLLNYSDLKQDEAKYSALASEK